MNEIMPPRFTMVPNVVLDNLHELDRTEIAIVMVLCRLTFGFHRHATKCSYTTLAKKCGLAPTTVRNATKRLEEKGWLVRKLDSGKAYIYELRINQEEDKDMEEEIRKHVKQEPLYDKAKALAEVCHMDFKANKGMLLNNAKKLPISSGEVLDLFGPGKAWYQFDFRGKKNSPPVVKQVLSEFKKLQQAELFADEELATAPTNKSIVNDDGSIYV